MFFVADSGCDLGCASCETTAFFLGALEVWCGKPALPCNELYTALITLKEEAGGCDLSMQCL